MSDSNAGAANEGAEKQAANETAATRRDAKDSGAAKELGRAKTSRRKLPRLLPTSSDADSARSWGDSSDSNDERLRNEKPPHW